MKPKTVILMGVAIVCGLVAALLVSMATATNKGPEMVTVLVAAEDLRQGTPLNNLPKQVRQAQVPADQVPPNVITDPKDLVGMQVVRNLDMKDVLTKAKIAKNQGLDSQLPPGHRAMTIRVSVDSAVAGFIQPGAHVDLLATAQDIHNSKLRLTKIFMQNMLVLAMNAQDVRDEKGKTIANPSTATLAVTPAQAEQLTRVVSEGTVTLVLRKPDDNKLVKTKGVINPFEEPKGDNSEPDEDVLAALDTIQPNTEVNEGNVDQLFVTKRLPKKDVPPDAVTVSKKDVVLKAKAIYHLLAKGQTLTMLNLQKPAAEKTETAGAGRAKRHVLRISNGSQPVIEVVYRGSDGTLTGGQQPPSEAPPPPAVPGSEGK